MFFFKRFKGIFKSFFTRLAFVVVLITISASNIFACNLSQVIFDSVVVVSSNYKIYFTIEIGAGVTGTNKGGGGDTRDIGIGIYSSGTINLSAFFPATITSDTVGCTQTGVDVGPVGSPFFSDQTIVYTDSYGCPAGFTCVSSTAVCGNAHTQSSQYSVTVDAMPDSIRIFGLEGAGNPIAGCYPDADNLIDFSSMPIVWDYTDGIWTGNSAILTWGLSLVPKPESFRIMRAEQGSNIFFQIDEISAHENRVSPEEFVWEDHFAPSGNLVYRVIAIDSKGENHYSPLINIRSEQKRTLEWIGGFFRDGALHYSIFSPDKCQIKSSIYSTGGILIKEAKTIALSGRNEQRIQTGNLPAGIYIVRIQSEKGTIQRKLIKL